MHTFIGFFIVMLVASPCLSLPGYLRSPTFGVLRELQARHQQLSAILQTRTFEPASRSSATAELLLAEQGLVQLGQALESGAPFAGNLKRLAAEIEEQLAGAEEWLSGEPGAAAIDVALERADAGIVELTHAFHSPNGHHEALQAALGSAEATTKAGK